MSYTFTVNGSAVDSDAPGLATLLSVLRDDLGLTGAKPGCGEGRCGACTTLLDGAPIASCLMPIAGVAGRDVRTVESLTPADGPLTAVQDALLAHGGVQCGACIPGVVMTLTAALEAAAEDPGADLDEAAVRRALLGNLCRCTGYHKIVEAALDVAGRWAR